MRSHTVIKRQTVPGQPGQVVINTTVRRHSIMPAISLLFILFMFWLAIVAISAINEAPNHYDACRVVKTEDCANVR